MSAKVPPPSEPVGSTALFYEGPDGKPQDSDLHWHILNNEAVDRRLAKLAVEAAIADGLDADTAERLYGYKP